MKAFRGQRRPRAGRKRHGSPYNTSLYPKGRFDSSRPFSKMECQAIYTARTHCISCRHWRLQTAQRTSGANTDLFSSLKCSGTTCPECRPQPPGSLHGCGRTARTSRICTLPASNSSSSSSGSSSMRHRLRSVLRAWCQPQRHQTGLRGKRPAHVAMKSSSEPTRLG